MKPITLPRNPNQAFSRTLDFPEASPEQRFFDREPIFHRGLHFVRDLCSDRALRSPEVFICHAHGQASYERWVARTLVPLLKEAGIRPILDKIDNGPGTSILEFMDKLISSDRVLVICTPHLCEKALPESGSTVAREMQRIEKRMRDDKKKDSVIPVLLAGDEETSLPAVLKGLVYADLRKMDRYHSQFFDLALQIRGLLDDDSQVQDWRYEIQDGCPVSAQ